MKLKYVVKHEGQIFLATCLQDIALHFNMSLSGIKYKIKHNLLDIQRCNTELHDLSNVANYNINKFGIVVIEDSQKKGKDIARVPRAQNEGDQNIDSNDI